MLFSLKQWWDLLLLFGPYFGYFPNGARSWLIVKEGVEDTARKLFADSDVHITTDGHRYLGGVIGSEAFKQQFLQQKLYRIEFLISVCLVLLILLQYCHV